MRQVLATAQLTWRAALRGGAGWVVYALLLALVVGLPRALVDDGASLGRAQVRLTYELGLCHALLCLAAVWLGADSFGRDQRRGAQALLDSRPLCRARQWLGRWLGVVAVVWCGSLASAEVVRWQARGGPAAVREVRAAGEQRRRLAPGQATRYEFGGQGRRRLRLAALAGDEPAGGVSVQLDLGAAGRRQVVLHPPQPWLQPDELPPGVGSLSVRNDGRATLLLEAVLLEPGCSFGANFRRAELALLLQLAALSALGVAAAAAWSTPVAALFCLTWLVVAAHAPLLHALGGHELGGLARAALAVTGALANSWPLGALADGWLLGGDWLGRVWVSVGLVQTGLTVALGVAIWSWRELPTGGDA